jgi:hypothetical protein
VDDATLSHRGRPVTIRLAGSPVHLGELFMVRKNNVEVRCVLRSRSGCELCLQGGLNRDFLETKACRTQDNVLEPASSVSQPG